MKRMITILLVIVFVLVACGVVGVDAKRGRGVDDIRYTVVEVEGMPCLIMQSDPGPFVEVGITCDWSKWEGELSR